MKAPTMISILALSLMATALPAEGSASASEMEALTQRDTAAASVIYSGVCTTGLTGGKCVYSPNGGNAVQAPCGINYKCKESGHACKYNTGGDHAHCSNL